MNVCIYVLYMNEQESSEGDFNLLNFEKKFLTFKEVYLKVCIVRERNVKIDLLREKAFALFMFAYD